MAVDSSELCTLTSLSHSDSLVSVYHELRTGPEAQPEEEDASEPEGEDEGGEDEGEGEEVEEEAGEVDDPLSPAAIASRLLSISVRDPAEPRSRWAPDLALADVD